MFQPIILLTSLSYDCAGGSVGAVTFSTGTGGTLAGEACMLSCSHTHTHNIT